MFSLIYFVLWQFLFLVDYLEKYSNGSDFSKEFIDALPWSLHYRYWIDNEETIGFITSMLMTFYNSGTEITLQHARQIIQVSFKRLFNYFISNL